MVAESRKCDEGRRPSSQRPQYPNLYRCLKRRLGLWSDRGKKATHKCSRVEGGFSGPSKVQGPIRKCDDRPSVQVIPSPVNRMVTASAAVQTNLSKVVHSSCRSICHSSEPQSSTVCISSPRPICLGHRCSEHKLVRSRCLCFPFHCSPLQPDQKRQPSCLIIVIAAGWPGMPWFWDLLQLSTEILLQLPVSTTLLKQSHNYVLHSNAQHLNLHAWCLGVDSSKNKASLWRWQRELLPLKGHQQGPSLKWALFEKMVQRKFGGFLHSLCETSLRFFHVSVPKSKQAPFNY